MGRLAILAMPLWLIASCASHSGNDAGRERVKTDIYRLFSQNDKDRDRKLSFPEFYPENGRLRADAKVTFDFLGSDKDGLISVSEYLNNQLSAFDCMDTNGDGTVDAAERRKAPQSCRKYAFDDDEMRQF